MMKRLLSIAALSLSQAAPAYAGHNEPVQLPQTPAYSGDVVKPAGSGAMTIQPNAVTAGKMATGAAVGNIGYTPLSPSSNLSDLQSAATARSNLGLSPVAASGSASDLASGTLSISRLPLSAYFGGGTYSSTVQGVYIDWNRQNGGGLGETDIYTIPGAGSVGGIAFFNGGNGVAPNFSGDPLAILAPRTLGGSHFAVGHTGWLEPIIAGTESSQPPIEALSPDGNSAGLFATQSGLSSSYCNNQGSSPVFCLGGHAIANFGINNVDYPKRQSVDAQYTEARRYGNAGPTQAHEIDVMNFGGVIAVQPFSMVPGDNPGNGTIPSGFTLGVAISAGRNDTNGANANVSAAYTINSNGALFDKGLVIGANSISGTASAPQSGQVPVYNGGVGEAIVMATGHAIDWISPASGNPVGARLMSSVTAAGAGQQLNFTNGGFQVLSYNGGSLFAQFGTTNYLSSPTVAQSSLSMSSPSTAAPSGTTKATVCADSNGAFYFKTTSGSCL